MNKPNFKSIVFLVLCLITTSCSSGGGSGSASSALNGNNGGLAAPGTTTPPVTPPPVTPVTPAAPVVPQEIAIDAGDQFTSDANLALSLKHPGMLKMKISMNATCDGGTWEAYGPTGAIALTNAQLNTRVQISVMFMDPEYAASKCYSSTILHDNIPPVIAVDTSVPALTNSVTQNLTFHAVDAGSGVSQLFCILPGQTSATPCNGNLSASLPDGGYVVQLLASDAAGNVSAPTSVSFTVDTTAPLVTLNSGPLSLTASSSASFTFSGSDNLSGLKGFDCKIDQQTTYSECVSGQIFSNVIPGNHTFAVRAIDNAGNTSVPATYTWTVDSSAPSIRFTQTPPAVSNSASAQFAFSGQESSGAALTAFECRLNGAAFSACVSAKILSGLNEGSNTFGVRGKNRLGVFSSELSYSWTIDLNPPLVTVNSGPAALINSTSANFTYSASDTLSGVASIRCRVDSAADVDCSSMVQAYSGLAANMQHSFQVVVTDQAGNSASSIPYIWFIDTTPPTVAVRSGPATISANTNASFQIAGSDDHSAVTYQCKLDDATVFTACSTSINYSNINDGAHTFYAQSRDAAGNFSTIATYVWSVDTVGPVIAFTQTPAATILTQEHGMLSYTVTDSSSTIASVGCTLDGVNINCTAVAATMTFPLLAVGNHSFTLKATNATGLTSSRSYSFSAQATCSTSLNTTTIPTKMLFIVDMSGSNQFSPGCSLSASCTDEGKHMRAGSIQQFLNEYKTHSNFSWAFDIFQNSSSTALINSGRPSRPIFSDATAMQVAITSFQGLTDDGGTPYFESLKLATKLVSGDPELNSASGPQYIVVFMSDGQPNGDNDSSDNILGQIRALTALAPGRVSFNSIYYGPANQTASDFLHTMADTGNGNFLNTNTNPTGLTFSITDLINVPVTTCQ